jgi:beta-glucuronidase
MCVNFLYHAKKENMTSIAKSIAAALLSLILAAAPACYDDAELTSIREIDGIPLLWQYGMPYFTRFHQTSHRQFSLKGSWKFMPDPHDTGMAEGWHTADYDDSKWFDHPVPGCWNTQRKEWLDYVGAGWYRRRFIAPVSMQGCFNRLVLDGVSFHGDVWLNGEHIGYHSGGFTQWSLDVSMKLHYGRENLIVIRADTRRDYETLPPLIREDRPFGWWPYGGITRHVTLESSPWTTLCKLALQTDYRGTVSGVGIIYNARKHHAKPTVTVSLSDRSGNGKRQLFRRRLHVAGMDVAAFTFCDRIEGVKTWSPETPENRSLITVRVIGPENSEKQSIEIGFRSFEFRGTRLYLNGRPFFVRGINRHEDDPETGAFQSDKRIQDDITLIQELNANFVRTAHYPHTARFLDLCDRKGILVQTEIPLYQVGWGVRSLRAAQKSRLYHEASRQLIEMIERDRNHPCVVMWSVGNECFTLFPSIKRLYRRLITLAKRFDSIRPVTFSIFSIPFGISPRFEIAAGLADVIFVNQYFGWYFKEAGEVSELLERIHEKWPDKPIIISEMGGGAVRGRKSGGRTYEIGYGNSRDFSEEFQTMIYRTQLPLIREKDYVSGVIPWVFADFRDDKRWRNPIPNFNLKGLLTYDRRKKDAFGVVSDFYARIQNELSWK